MIAVAARVFRLVSVPVWLLLAATLASPAWGQPRVPRDAVFSLSPQADSAPAPDGARHAPWWRDHFALRFRGLVYHDEFVFRRQNLRLRLSGPIVKGNPGLRVEVRGWELRGATARISAYGSAKRQGFKLEIEF